MTQLRELIDMLDGAGLIIEDPEAIDAELTRMGFDPHTDIDPIENNEWEDDDWDEEEDFDNLPEEDQYFCQHGENKYMCEICNEQIDSGKLFGDDELDYTRR